MFTAENISIKVRTKHIIKDSSLHVPEGTAAIFIGANGSGKTTTIRGITGLIPLSSGTSSLLGNNRRANLGFSIGSEYLPPKMRVADFLSFSRDKTLTDHSAELLESCDMATHTKKMIGKLSMGMKQKVAICTALRYNPQNIILDEPHNGLDPESIGWLNNLIHEQKKRGASLLVSSHLLKEVAEIGDIAYQMKDQQISPVPWPPVDSTPQHTDTLIVETADLPAFLAVLDESQIQYQVKDARHVEVDWTVRQVLKAAHDRNLFVENLQWK